MPIAAVDPFVRSLPKDDSFPFRIMKASSNNTLDEKDVQMLPDEPIGAKKTKEVIDAFAVLDEYDALGYYDKDDPTGDSSTGESL